MRVGLGDRFRRLFGRHAGDLRAARAPRFKVLIVCMANVCRSPMACIVANQTLQRDSPSDDVSRTDVTDDLAIFESAGIHAETGAGPDTRAQKALSRRGYAVEGARSRAVAPFDFERFDFLLAMDSDVLAELRAMCPTGHAHKLKLFLSFSPGLDSHEVPDPYYGDSIGFERVLDLCEVGARGLIVALRRMRDAELDARR